jgi:hypothetical protein
VATWFAISFTILLIRTLSSMRLSVAIKTGTCLIAVLVRAHESRDRTGI